MTNSNSYEKKDDNNQDNQKKESEVVSFIKFLITMFILVALIRGTIVEAYRIPSASMRPTLIEQDHILVTKFDYGFHLAFVPTSIFQFTTALDKLREYFPSIPTSLDKYVTPERFDVVVFTLDENPDTNYIKRVIALPGETVEVRGTTVYVNGEPQKDPEKVQWLDGGVANFGPATVPEGHVFLMGDNRDHSRDSRFWDNPFLNVNRIKGKARIIYWNFASLGRLGTIIR